jgi:hypothetical protein
MKDDPKFFEKMRPLAQSSIWRFMRAFYDRRGLSAWTEGTVPSQVTNHAGLAFVYSKLAAAWVDDLVAEGALGRDQTVYALELGGGTGRLAYGVVKHYEHVRKQLDLPRICYVLSDFTETNIDAHRKNPALRELVDAGLMDFCTFDATNPQVPTLVESRQSLGALLERSPLLAVANYLFDSLPHDFFRVRDGVIVEGLCSLSSADGEEPEYKHREQIEDVKLHFHYVRTQLPHYGEGTLDRLLEFYGELENVSVLFPSVGLRCVESLRAMAKGRLLLLTADKATTHVEELAGDREPFVAHHGAFSITANYHALSVYAAEKGGLALLPPPRDGPLTYCVLRFDDRPNDPRRLEHAFDEAMVQQSPTDWHTLSWHLPENLPNAKLEYYLALLRTSGCDPVMVTRLEKELMAFKAEPTYRQLREVEALVERAGEVYLHVHADDPFLGCALRLLVAFELDRALERFVAKMQRRYGTRVDIAALLDKARADC